MKKFITAIVCALWLTALAFGICACSDGKSADAVNLVAINAAQVGTADNIDYYVAAEPAATARVNAVKDLNFVGDLQKLYGGENGYPQAVIVAGNGLVNSSFCARFLNALSDSREWLLNQNPQTVTEAVLSRLTDGMTPTFNSENLSKQVMENCGVRLTRAEDSKTEIEEFMKLLNGVSGQSFGTPAESFFHVGSFPETEYSGKVKIYAPDGAPALGLAKLMAEDIGFGSGCEAQYNVVDASLIQTFVTGSNPAADICVLPVNLAVRLLGGGERYKLIGTLTHGNLYLLSKNGTKITSDNLSTLKGKTVGVVNLAAIPGLTFKLILKNNGVDYAEIK